MLRILTGAVFALFSLPTMAATSQWVHGNIEEIKEYGGAFNGGFQVAIYLKETSWKGAGNGHTACVQTYAGRTFYRFRLVDGINGITAASQERIFSMMLTAYTANHRVGLSVDTSVGPECTVELAALGDGY